MIGISMGIICGPSVANIFLFILERHWISIHRPLIYERFIDDVLIGLYDPLEEKNFESTFLYLKLNICSNDKINFLDLEISFNFTYNSLNFSLYTKPTNTYSYLLNSSNHPNHIYKNIIVSTFTRIRRICSNYIEYLHHANILSIHLQNRGYKKELIKGISRSIVHKSSVFIYLFSIANHTQ